MCSFICSTFYLLMVVVSFEIFLFSSAAPLYPSLPSSPIPNTRDEFGIGGNSWWSSMKPSSKKDLISTMITSESQSRDSNDYVPRLLSLPSTYNSDKQIDDSSVVDDDTDLKNSMKESSSNASLMNNLLSPRKERETHLCQKYEWILAGEKVAFEK